MDRLRTERRPAFDIAGDWKAAALGAGMWVEAVTEGRRRLVVAWRKMKGRRG